MITRTIKINAFTTISGARPVEILKASAVFSGLGDWARWMCAYRCART